MKKCFFLLTFSVIFLNVSFSQSIVDKDVNPVFTKYFDAIATNNHSKRLDTYDKAVFDYAKREVLQEAYEKEVVHKDQKITFSNPKITRIGNPVNGQGKVYKVVDYTYEKTITPLPKKEKKQEKVEKEESPEEPINAENLTNPEDQKRFKKLQKRQKKNAGVAPVSEPEKPKTLTPFEAKVKSYQDQFGDANVSVNEKNQAITIKQTAKLITIKRGNKTGIVEFNNGMIPVLKQIIPAETLLKIGKS